jgi:hypothetical protein
VRIDDVESGGAVSRRFIWHSNGLAVERVGRRLLLSSYRKDDTKRGKDCVWAQWQRIICEVTVNNMSFKL